MRIAIEIHTPPDTSGWAMHTRSQNRREYPPKRTPSSAPLKQEHKPHMANVTLHTIVLFCCHLTLAARPAIADAGQVVILRQAVVSVKLLC